jgi:hypothetical protein
MLYLFIIIKQTPAAYVIISALLGGSYLANQYIGVNSYINHIKFINLFSFLDAAGLITRYQNLNIFGAAVAERSIFFMVVPMLIVVLLVLNIAGYLGQKQWSLGFLVRGLDFLKRKLDVIYFHSSFVLHESQRILFTHKGIVIIIILTAVQYNSIKDSFVTPDLDNTIYRDYISTWGGVLTSDTIKLIEQEAEVFMRMPEKMNNIGSELDQGIIDQQIYENKLGRLRLYQQKQKAFTIVQMQVSELNEIKKNRDIDVWLIDPSGFNKLFGTKDHSDDISNMLMAALAIVLVSCSVYAYENKKKLRRIFKSCKNGRCRLVASRLIIVAIIVLVVVTIIYGMHYYNTNTLYDLSALNAPIQSISAFSNFELYLNIGQYIIMITCIRIISFMLLAVISLLISSLSKNEATAIIISIFIICAPIIAYQLGLKSVANFSLIPVLSGSMLFVSKNVGALIKAIWWITGVLVLGIFLYVVTLRKYLSSQEA